MNNKYLPHDKYKALVDTDKMIITLGKNLLNFDNLNKDVKFIVTKEILEIVETIDCFDNEENNISQKSTSLKVEIDLDKFNFLREILKDSFNYHLYAMDIVPASIECFSKDKKIYNGQFNECCEEFNEFLSLCLKSPILISDFKTCSLDKLFNKKTTSPKCDIPF